MAGITVFQVISTVVAVAGAVQQRSASKKARKATQNAAAERREANKVVQGAQQNTDRIARRKALREERVRRAKIIQSADNRGAGGSSGQQAGPGILGTNVAAAISAQSSGARAATGVSDRLQSAADFDGQANAATSSANLFASIGSSVVGVAEQFDIFQQPVFPSTKKA